MDELSNLPVVDAAGPYPGGWRQKDGASVKTWQGETSWITRHGDGTVRWLLGRPVAAYGASLAGAGTLERCETFSPFDQQFWRRPNPYGPGYVTGLLTISNDGIVFVDAPRPVDDEEPIGIIADMLAHPDAKALFQKDGFAGAFNEYLRNADFRRNGTDDLGWSASFRAIGGIIANIRGIGESYLDFYLHAPAFSEADTADVEALLEAVGWHRMSDQELASQHSQALALLEEIEARPDGAIPMDQRIGLATDRDRVANPRSASGRMHIASIDGKATAEEHHRFFALYDFDQDRMTPEDLAALIKQDVPDPAGPGGPAA